MRSVNTFYIDLLGTNMEWEGYDGLFEFFSGHLANAEL